MSMTPKSEEQKAQEAKEAALEPLGLRYIKVDGDGHCLYNSIALYLGKDVSILRNEVADYLEQHKEDFSVFFTHNEGITLDKYIELVRKTNEWGNHIELEILMKIYQRPIFVIDTKYQLINSMDTERFPGEPIFILYNEHDHYDGVVLLPGQIAKSVLIKIQRQTQSESASIVHSSMASVQSKSDVEIKESVSLTPSPKTVEQEQSITNSAQQQQELVADYIKKVKAIRKNDPQNIKAVFDPNLSTEDLKIVFKELLNYVKKGYFWQKSKRRKDLASAIMTMTGAQLLAINGLDEDLSVLDFAWNYSKKSEREKWLERLISGESSSIITIIEYFVQAKLEKDSSFYANSTLLRAFITFDPSKVKKFKPLSWWERNIKRKKDLSATLSSESLVTLIELASLDDLKVIMKPRRRLGFTYGAYKLLEKGNWYDLMEKTDDKDKRTYILQCLKSHKTGWYEDLKDVKPKEKSSASKDLIDSKQTSNDSEVRSEATSQPESTSTVQLEASKTVDDASGSRDTQQQTEIEQQLTVVSEPQIMMSQLEVFSINHQEYGEVTSSSSFKQEIEAELPQATEEVLKMSTPSPRGDSSGYQENAFEAPVVMSIATNQPESTSPVQLEASKTVDVASDSHDIQQQTEIEQQLTVVNKSQNTTTTTSDLIEVSSRASNTMVENQDKETTYYIKELFDGIAYAPCDPLLKQGEQEIEAEPQRVITEVPEPTTPPSRRLSWKDKAASVKTPSAEDIGPDLPKAEEPANIEELSEFDISESPIIGGSLNDDLNFDELQFLKQRNGHDNYLDDDELRGINFAKSKDSSPVSFKGSVHQNSAGFFSSPKTCLASVNASSKEQCYDVLQDLPNFFDNFGK